ncbi:hypothetical protein OSB04_017891 [Centaurea solstitialis]|uniref:Uncharacterized protein n=1 Tax=Centaurea solstitialis TaxID=347529 RepID=A0AA38TGY1_9ASTR|nr:hypothetical protein OSB04_017891 [Centaurea solstitialis]
MAPPRCVSRRSRYHTNVVDYQKSRTPVLCLFKHGKYEERRCGFIRWFDPPMCNRSVEIIPGLLCSKNLLEAKIRKLEHEARRWKLLLLITWNDKLSSSTAAFDFLNFLNKAFLSASKSSSSVLLSILSMSTASTSPATLPASVGLFESDPPSEPASPSPSTLPSPSPSTLPSPSPSASPSPSPSASPSSNGLKLSNIDLSIPGNSFVYIGCLPTSSTLLTGLSVSNGCLATSSTSNGCLPTSSTSNGCLPTSSSTLHSSRSGFGLFETFFFLTNSGCTSSGSCSITTLLTPGLRS